MTVEPAMAGECDGALRRCGVGFLRASRKLASVTPAVTPIRARESVTRGAPLGKIAAAARTSRATSSGAGVPASIPESS